MSITPETEPARQRAQALIAAARPLDMIGDQSTDNLLRVAEWILAEPDVDTAETEGPAPQPIPKAVLARAVNRMNAERARRKP